MFTGLWLRICFGFGSQQQTVTITTPGVADIQFASTPTLDIQHRYASFLSFSHHGSSFADTLQSAANSDRLLFRALTWGTGQFFLTIQGNVQRRYSLHTPTRASTSTRRAIARGRPNSTVRYFPSSKPLTPGQNSLQKPPSHSTAYHPTRHLPHITRYHNSISDPLTPTPQCSLLPRRSPAPSPNGYSTTRNVRGGRRLCVYVSSEILPLALTQTWR